MKVFIQYLAFSACTAIVFFGCSSSKQETVADEQTTVPYKTVIESTGLKESSGLSEHPRDYAKITTVPEQILSWKPHFIATGLASGIMIEFTGMKKDKPVNAKFASIELQSAETSITKAYTTTINSLRQAFFEIPPGRYIVHQAKNWANQSFIHDVEVKDGHYSVIYIDVVNPRASKSKEISERQGE